MRINNNIQALNAYRNLSSNQFNTSKNLERLSSGLRINRAADDAAGLAISEKMRAQIRGLQMAERNSLDGISLIQTAEGALTEVHSMLHRMRELAVQAANDTNTEGDRKEIQKEIDQLTSEINRIGNATEFNTKKLLNGGATRIAPSVEKYGVSITEGAYKLTDLGSDKYSLEVSKSFVAGEQIVIDNQTFTFVESGAGANEINIGSTIDEQASHIKEAIENHSTLKNDYTVQVVDNKLTLTDTKGSKAAPVIGTVGNAQGTVHFNVLNPAGGSDPAKYELDITNGFRENETIKIGNETFTGVRGKTPGTGEFSVEGNASDQANSLLEAIKASALVTTSPNGYNASKSGTKIILEEQAAGSTATAITKPETHLTAAIPGEFKFNIERSIVGQSFTIDGVEIKVVNDSTQFNDDVNTGKAMRHSDSLTVQAENLRKAIERNPELGQKYFVQGTGNEIVLKQRSGHESSVLPDIMLSNTGDGDVFKSNLQIGPNQHQILTVELNDIRSPKIGISTTDPRTKIVDMNGDLIEGAAFNVIKNVSNGLSEGFVEYSIDVSSHEKASAAIKVFDTAIERINGERASLGALQNRLEHTINNLKVTHENLSSSESRIRDADMALEMTAFTKNNILNQSAQAMLAQANQLPQGVLQLLQG
ncbi:flagellin [Bacillus sp. JJ1532]|uniref:flagellin N-terminal helical domain-containing protein n=1 Tax=Bacillus sp. JJ1532 TaxID=3122958 RepID=UPI002FFDB442